LLIAPKVPSIWHERVGLPWKPATHVPTTEVAPALANGHVAEPSVLGRHVMTSTPRRHQSSTLPTTTPRLPARACTGAGDGGSAPGAVAVALARRRAGVARHARASRDCASRHGRERGILEGRQRRARDLRALRANGAPVAGNVARARWRASIADAAGARHRGRASIAHRPRRVAIARERRARDRCVGKERHAGCEARVSWSSPGVPMV
jgi:hypothetical protein